MISEAQFATYDTHCTSNTGENQNNHTVFFFCHPIRAKVPSEGKRLAQCAEVDIKQLAPFQAKATESGQLRFG